MARASRSSKPQNATSGEDAIAADPFIQEVQDAISALLKRGSDPTSENALDPKEMNAVIANGIKFLQFKHGRVMGSDEGDFWEN